MDYKTIELTAKLTEKAMGAEGSVAGWIGHEDTTGKPTDGQVDCRKHPVG
jgi:hypothetical protein